MGQVPRKIHWFPMLNGSIYVRFILSHVTKFIAHFPSISPYPLIIGQALAENEVLSSLSLEGNRAGPLGPWKGKGEMTVVFVSRRGGVGWPTWINHTDIILDIWVMLSCMIWYEMIWFDMNWCDMISNDLALSYMMALQKYQRTVEASQVGDRGAARLAAALEKNEVLGHGDSSWRNVCMLIYTVA